MPRSVRRKNRVARRRLALVFALIFAPAAERAARATCLEFVTPPPIAQLISRAWPVVAADLDGDGDLDAVASSSSPTNFVLAWLENDGNGGGWAFHTVATSTYSLSLAAADIDSDGDVDLFAPRFLSGAIEWFENTNSGATWGRHTASTDFLGPYSIDAVDVDGDGDLDALAAAREGNRLSWFENDDPEVAWVEHVLATTPSNLWILGADLDRDGDQDALAVSGGGTLAWYQNDGTPAVGTWTAHTVTDAVGFIQTADAADVDGDGDLDALTIGGNLVTWFENDGTGADWTRWTISTHVSGGWFVGSADLDGDGDADVLSTSYTDDRVAWYENDGAGASWILHTISTSGAEPYVAVPADLDGDGDLDLLSSAGGDSSVSWHRNDLLHGTALFAVSPTIATLATSLSSLSAVDLDRDGDLDGLSSSFSGDRIEWYENSAAAGDASSWTSHLVADTADGALAAEAADIDGDGDPDIVAANYINGFWWYANTAGDASIWSAVAIHSGALPANDIVAADLDRDGDLDAVSAWGGAHTVAWHENTDAEGDGSAWSEHVVATNVGYALLADAADLDGDGDLDVLVADSSVDTIIWFANDGTPATGTWTSLSIASVLDPRAMATADVDGDGDLDVLSAGSDDDTIAWHENDGTPLVDPQTSWTARPISTVANGASWVTAADADGDGDLDVIAGASSFAASAHWYENDGSPATGPWTFHTISTTMAACYAAIPADLDGDGDLDVLGTGNPISGLRWFPNVGTKVHDDGFDSDGNTACWSTSVPPVP